MRNRAAPTCRLAMRRGAGRFGASTRSGAVTAALVFAAAPALAQAGHDSTAASRREPSVRHVRTDTVYTLPTVRVTAKRVWGEMPSTGTQVRVDGAELRRFQPTTVVDALATVPGLDVVKTGPWEAKVSLRGLGGDRVLVLVDGVRLNQVRGHGAEPSLVPVDQVEAVELVPGASSGRYGSSALAGVVNLVTRRTLFEPRPRLRLSLGSRFTAPGDGQSATVRIRYGRARLGGEVSGGLGRLRALTTAQGDIPNSSYRDRYASARLAGQLGAWLLDAEHQNTRATDVGLPAFNSAAGGSGSYPERGRDATRLDARRFGAGRLREARVLADRQRYTSFFRETTVDSVFLRQRYVGTRTAQAEDRVHTTSLGVQPSVRVRLPLDTRLHAEYRRDETDGPRDLRETVRDREGVPVSETPSRSASVPPSFRETWAAGLGLARGLGPLRLETGVRHDRIHAHTEATPDGRFTALEAMDARTSWDGGLAAGVEAFEPYVHAGTGFRAPNLDERYFNGFVHGYLHLFGNAALRPERSRSFEAGLRTRRAWGRLASARISVYRSDVDDLITFRYVGQLYLVPRFQYVNVERARLEGVETSVRVQLPGNSTVGLDAALPRGLDRLTGARLDEVGPARVTLDAAWSIPRVPRVSAALRVRWSDATREIASALERRSFWTSSVQLGCEFAGLRAALAVRNLFNADYQEPLSFIPEPGRTFAVSLHREFTLTPTRPEEARR